MNELVFKSSKGNPVTNSLLVAEKFEKNHKDVLRTIKNLIQSAQNCAHFYYATTYVDSRNRNQEMFIMNRDGFSLLVMGFTGEKALSFKIDFINAFNKMEEALKSKPAGIPQNFAEALELAAKQARQLEETQKKLEEQRPAVILKEAISASKDTVLVSDLAKLLAQNGVSIGQNRLFQWMRKNGYLLSSNGYYNRPAQRYIENGLFELKESTFISGEEIKTSITTKVTGKGQVYFINKFLNTKQINL